VPQKLAVGEVAKFIGRRIFVGTGSATPEQLLTPMREHALGRDGSTDVFYMSTFAGPENFTPEVTATGRWNTNLFFLSPGNRLAANEGRAKLHRGSLYQLSKRIDKGEFAFDTVVVRVSKPDAEGYVSLGTTADLTLHALKQVLARGGKVIAEVNANVPHMAGNRIKFSDVAAYYENELLLTEANMIWPTDREWEIGRNVSRLIPNRRLHTMQGGIGTALGGLRDETIGSKRINIWSEMGTDGWVLPLLNRNRPAVFSFLHGSNWLYSQAGAKANVSMAGNGEVNDPQVIASKKRIVAVNTALEVDVLGNVNAERAGKKIISAPGGQPDFMKGAALAKDGKAILALRSIAKGGESGVVLKLNSDVVTTPKDHVDYVVTEWGATKRLRGESDNTRVYEIVRVAHPFHRIALTREAQAKGLLTAAQVAKLERSVYHSIRRAPPELRQETLEPALAKGLITQAQRDEITGLAAQAVAQ
jgi:acyl-CoA hydrolase